MENICLNKNIYIKQMSKESYYIFNKKNKKSFEFGKTEGEILLSIQEECREEEFLKKNSIYMNKGKLIRFLKVLEEQGFLKGKDAKINQTVTKIKIGIFNPSKNIDSDSGIIKLLYRLLFILPVILLGIGIMALIYQNVNFLELITQYEFDWKDVGIIIAIFLGMTFFHECAHMIIALYHKVPVPELGIMLYWFAPCAYVDVSTIHFLKDKGKKIQVMIGGIMVHIAAVGIGMIILAFGSKLSIITLAFTMINLSAILINITFYLKLDGYFILTILLDEPNLREKSLGFIVSFLTRKMENYKKEVFSNKILYGICGFIMFIYIPALVGSLVLRVMPVLINVIGNII